MRFHLGPPPSDPTFHPQPPWQPLREPHHIALLLALAIPLGVLTAVGYVVLALFLQPTGELVLSGDRWTLVAVFVLIPTHELLHALSVPGSLASPHLVLGVWPRAFVAYVHYTGELTRERWLLTALCPLVAVTVATLALSRLVPAWREPVLVFGLLNAIGAGGDLLSAVLVLAQVPPGASLRNQGWRTFWRPR